MTNEQFERWREFIVETLARVSVNDEKHQKNHEEHEKRLDRLERIAKLMVRAGLRERQTRSEADIRLSKALAELAESQKHSDRKLDALVDIVRQQQNDRSS
jgi:hypothetical protein